MADILVDPSQVKAIEVDPSQVKAYVPPEPSLGDQPWSVGGVLGTMAGQAGSALGTAASDIAGMPAGLYNAVRHPFDTLSQMATPPHEQIPESQMPQDAFHKLQRMLGGGPNYHPMGENTPTSEVIGHGLAMLPLTAAPEIAGAAKKVGPVVAGAAKGGWQGSTAPSTFRFRGLPVEVPVPAAVSAAGIGYEVGKHFPFVNPEIGGAVGGAIGGAIPGIRGAFRGAMDVLRPKEMPPAPGEPPVAPVAATPPPPPGVDPNAWGQLTPEIQDAIYRGAAARKTATPAYSTTTPENISIIPEGEHNIIRKVAETNRGNKDLTIVRSLKDEGITKDTLAKMSDDDLRARVKALGYTPSYGKNYSRTWAAFRRDIDTMMDSPALPNPINAKPIPPK